MFLRIRGRRIYLLHNYRDGKSNVRQRCLFRADLAGGLQQWLSIPGWEEIRARVAERCPEMKVNWERIREQLVAALPLRDTSPSQPRKRRVFDPSEPEAERLQIHTEQRAIRLTEQQRWGALARLQRQHYRRCPGPAAAEALATSLQRAGRVEEALEKWAELPRRDAQRYLNSALILWQQNRLEDATEQLLLGLNRNFLVGEALRQKAWNWGYWGSYGHLWDQRARNFFLSVMADPAARFHLRAQHQRGLRVRRWLPPYGYTRFLLERVRRRLEAAGEQEIFYSSRWFIYHVRPAGVA